MNISHILSSGLFCSLFAVVVHAQPTPGGAGAVPPAPVTGEANLKGPPIPGSNAVRVPEVLHPQGMFVAKDCSKLDSEHKARCEAQKGVRPAGLGVPAMPSAAGMPPPGIMGPQDCNKMEGEKKKQCQASQVEMKKMIATFNACKGETLEARLACMQGKKSDGVPPVKP